MKPFAVAPLLLLALAAAPVAGQVTPIPESDFDQAAAQYRSYALGEFQTVVGEWVEAINAGTPEAAARLYTPDAYIDIEEQARGSEEIIALLRRWSEGLRHLQVGLSDFDASGRMAYGTLQARLSPAEGSGRTGRILLVMRRDGRTWRIRAQTLSVF